MFIKFAPELKGEKKSILCDENGSAVMASSYFKERQRETERDRERETVCVCVYVSVRLLETE